LGLLLAVMERRANLPVQGMDVYAMAVGGVRVIEPGADLALCLALASAMVGHSIGEDVVACGEVGLGGELRQVGRLDRRLAEASRLGFKRAFVPRSAPDVDAPIELIRVPTLAAALSELSLQAP